MYRQRIFEDLTQLQIQRDDTVLLHSSYRSLGSDRPKAKAFLQIILDYLHQGTLILPTLTYLHTTAQNPCFDQRKTQSCVGYLTEVFRTEFPSLRSLHPTHSVCALGKNALALTRDHIRDDTPCGPHSPFALLPKYQGKVLLLGCDLNRNTFLHAVEELIEPVYLFGKPLNYTLISEAGTSEDKVYRTHGFDGWEIRFDRILDTTDDNWIVQGKVLEAHCYVMDTVTLQNRALEKMKTEPCYFAGPTHL